MHFRDLTLERKLLLFAALSSVFTLLVTCAGTLVYDVTIARASRSDDLKAQAALVATNSAAALAAYDRKRAGAILSSLQSRHDITTAALYLPDSKLLVAYQRNPAGTAALPATPMPAAETSDGWTTRVVHPVSLRGRLVGTLYLESSVGRWRAQLIRQSTLILGLISLAALLALLICTRLQRTIAEPITDLHRALKAVAIDRNFALRVKRAQHDDVGSVADGVNTLLIELQRRDVSLQRATETVQARTTQLEEQSVALKRLQTEIAARDTLLETRATDRIGAADGRGVSVSGWNALEHQTRLLRSILDSMSDGVIVADETGHIAVINRAARQLLAVDAADALTDDWFERHGLYQPDMVTIYRAEEFPLMRAVRGHTTHSVPVFVLGNRDEPQGLWLSIDATPLAADDGTVHNGVAIFRNVTSSMRAVTSSR